MRVLFESLSVSISSGSKVLKKKVWGRTYFVDVNVVGVPTGNILVGKRKILHSGVSYYISL